MSVTRQQIVETARSYVGTPYQHQGRLRGVGVDCVGLLVCVARDLGVSKFDFRAYRRIPDGAQLLAALDQELERLDDWRDARAGDVLVERVTERMPQHCMIVSERIESEFGVEWTVIHARAPYGVIEHRLDPWHVRRIHSAYRVRDVVD
jgi:cell wall-associated NlpC family hydrolase